MFCGAAHKASIILVVVMTIDDFCCGRAKVRYQELHKKTYNRLWHCGKEDDEHLQEIYCEVKDLVKHTRLCRKYGGDAAIMQLEHRLFVLYENFHPEVLPKSQRSRHGLERHLEDTWGHDHLEQWFDASPATWFKRMGMALTISFLTFSTVRYWSSIIMPLLKKQEASVVSVNSSYVPSYDSNHITNYSYLALSGSDQTTSIAQVAQ